MRQRICLALVVHIMVMMTTMTALLHVILAKVLAHASIVMAVGETNTPEMDVVVFVVEQVDVVDVRARDIIKPHINYYICPTKTESCLISH